MLFCIDCGMLQYKFHFHSTFGPSLVASRKSWFPTFPSSYTCSAFPRAECDPLIHVVSTPAVLQGSAAEFRFRCRRCSGAMPQWLGLLGVLVLRAECLDTVASVAISSHGEARMTLCLCHSRIRLVRVPYSPERCPWSSDMWLCPRSSQKWWCTTSIQMPRTVGMRPVYPQGFGSSSFSFAICEVERRSHMEQQAQSVEPVGRRAVEETEHV